MAGKRTRNLDNRELKQQPMTDLERISESGPAELLVEMGRLNGLSDGVFAIALTLLVLDIRLPENILVGDLSAGILELAPKALVYLISFVVIGGAWGSHQRMLSQIRHGDGLLVWLNLFSLLFVTLVPASAAVLGRFPRAFLAISCFAVNVFLIQLTALWLWRYASRHGLVNPALDARVVVGIGRRLGMSAAIFGISIPVALVNRSLSYALWIGIFVFLFTTDWLSWQQAIKTQHSSVPLGDATEAYIRVQHAMGQLVIDANDETLDLLQGTFGGGLDSQVGREGKVVKVALSMRDQRGFMNLRYPWAWGPVQNLDWNLGLNKQIRLVLDVETSRGQARLDLGQLQISQLNVETGASSMLIALPGEAGHTSVHIEAGRASLVLQVPPEVAARIRTSQAIASAEIDVDRFPMAENRHEYRSLNYADAANRVDIMLKVALGSVKIV